ncbi:MULTISPECIES: ABC transporter permease [Chryseobacterium]|uniref:ABC-2 type transport system permease protein n=1 Tax=Chryseobacterium camelliae TaxID=1265445 RepID=A0ABU0TLJ3_9FLAO|nr:MULTISPECIES: ABC transporter permease [Chryseobacterium]MDT3408227.1 ABC-2 type transport system permease protein [Pseudacidovorax intermedius]MDQ1097919.1 ABC-2 type transport system permease protein [Chryseobacterium camelliae]MDQ1101850.1 ABC-2 type transport system permease protein [Chryseobacterium sp. SORGH_AS_1048]MDR6085290.1 ABC-2 type transport system permease protein [Chryseobacterium sp. SORGH_AS_0909]MDR6129647.1 ABC-2 type transport system permease protein [Chryseobacterium s
MLYKLWRTFLKEILLLKRDIGGIVIIFVMPLLLIVTITLIQDSTFKNLEGTRIPIIFIDNDRSEVSKSIRQELEKSKSFELKTQFTEASARNAVFSGEYQMAIVIPENLTNALNTTIDTKVQKIVSSFGLETDAATHQIPSVQTKEIHLYFDPAINSGFRNSVMSAVNKMVFEIENKKIYKAFQEQLGTTENLEENKNLIAFKEITPPRNNGEAIPNSVQHNVPAWTLFAIFFIVVPLSINLVKEKSQGTSVRVRISPTPYYIHILGKTFTYLIICVIQFLLMVAVGIYLFPYMDLPAFDVSGKMFPLMIVTLAAGLAAIGFGVLLGTIADTQEQSAPFGATSVVVLAAVGGIWVPVFLMPEFMQHIARFSPMNWGLNAYYDIILRNSGISSIATELILLILFYLVMVSLSIIYERKLHRV